MSDHAPPVVTRSAADDAQEALTPDAIEAVLADFRSWLEQIAQAPATDVTPTVNVEPIDLATLMGHFIALRHEVNLQTKASRGQQEQTGETLRQLEQAVQALRQSEKSSDESRRQAQEEQLRPFLKTLVDVADALALAKHELQRGQQVVWSSLDQLTQITGPLTQTKASQPKDRIFAILEKWFGDGGKPPAASFAQPEKQARTSEVAERIRQLLDSLITGYAMGLQRVERALQHHGLEKMVCVGQPFDPERMEVVEVVAANLHAPGEVVEDVRAGYMRNGRVFRYAQVRVAKA